MIQKTYSQQWVENITDFFEHTIGNPKDTSHYHTKIVVSPVVSFEPATSWAFGAGTKFLFKFKGSGEETRTSNIPLSARYTLNNQFIFTSDYTMFSNQEKWMFRGRVTYQKYPIAFYGIGSETTKDDEIELSYSQLLFEPLILKNITKKFFAGGGLRYNRIYNTEIEGNSEFLGGSADDSIASKSVGLELALTYDSRSNVLNPSSGYFIEYTFGTYQESMGSSADFELSRLDARMYKKFFKSRPDDTWAFQLFSRFSWGDKPLLEFSTLGGQELLRGTQEGRYRDRNAVFLQTEYRWQTFERLGFVFFTGMGDVFDQFDQLDPNSMKYNAGTGIRLKIVKEENLNVRFDYGFTFGHEFDSAFYLNLAETF